jgi:hypothetical protein
MDKVDGDANWSALAAESFLAEINRIKARKSALRGKPMDAAIERLKKSKVAFSEQARTRGLADGSRWAMEIADYGELRELARRWNDLEFDDDQDAAFTFVQAISAGRQVGSMERTSLLIQIGKDAPGDTDATSSAYWKGFGESALEVFEKVDY